MENPNSNRREAPPDALQPREKRSFLRLFVFGTAFVTLPATAPVADAETDFREYTTMFNMNELKQSLIAGLAALVLTATAVGAAVGPAENIDGGTILAAAQLDASARA